MKLHPDAQTALNTITAHDEGFIEINAQRFEYSVFAMPEGEVQSLPARDFASLTEQVFLDLAALQPELVILGTGKKQHFPHPKLTKALLERRIGIESMSTAAAARTYNILMAEGRKVLGAFIIEA